MLIHVLSIYFDLCKMRCYAAAHRCQLVIDLDSELACNRMAHCISDVQIPFVWFTFAALCGKSASCRRVALWQDRGIASEFYRNESNDEASKTNDCIYKGDNEPRSACNENPS